MGSICFDRIPANVTDFAIAQYEFESETLRIRVLDTKFVCLRTVYLALERLDKLTGKTMVYAGVMKVMMFPRASSERFCFNTFDETCGPIFHDCPRSILDMLSPFDEFTIDPAYAVGWREKCYANLARREEAKKVKPGDWLYFPHGLRFDRWGKISLFRADAKGSAYAYGADLDTPLFLAKVTAKMFQDAKAQIIDMSSLSEYTSDALPPNAQVVGTLVLDTATPPAIIGKAVEQLTVPPKVHHQQVTQISLF